MKRTVLIVVTAAMAVLCVGCASEKEDRRALSDDVKTYVSGEGSLKADASFTCCIDAAPVIFKGVCVESNLNEERLAADLSVRVAKVFRGNIHEDDVLFVRADDISFVKDEEYLFMTIPMASVYEDIELYYQADSVFPMTEGGSYEGYLKDISGLSNDELTAKLEEYVSENEYRGEYNMLGSYCKSDDVNEVFDFSDCVVKVKVKSVFLDSISDRTTYVCTVLESVKGKASEEINVTAFKNSLEDGKEYLLLLMGSEESGYTMSSKISVLDADSEQATLILGK
ncbi:MAG: hypothetical protein IKX58_07735 [Clostridia bacterium]|nr:hypothetical protein [Clostridia bacterium]